MVWAPPCNWDPNDDRSGQIFIIEAMAMVCIARYIFVYTKRDMVLIPRSETDADNPFVLGDEGYDVFP